MLAEGDGGMLDGSEVNLVRCNDEMDDYIRSLEDEEVDAVEPEGPEDAWWMMISTDMIHFVRVLN